MDKQQAEELLERYRNNLCTPEERERLELLFMQQVQNTEVPKNDAVSDEIWDAVSEHIAKNGNPYRRRIRRSLLIKYASAAILLIIASISVYNKFRNTESSSSQVRIIEDIKPGGNRAYLTLADGRQIALDSTANGLLAQQAGMEINKTADGEVIYNPSKTPSHVPITENPIFNTITTPKGGQYQITLPDGSKVWLNAASSIKFPASFAGLKDRKVELTGEGYFEVTKDKMQPFIVITSTQQVQVLGTHFNINSYLDEPAVKTTLLEGAVRIFSTRLNLSKTITPGQTATHQNERITIEAADETAVAWTQGMLEFKQADLRSILRQVSRWYDLKIIYQGTITSEKFTGGISRKSNLSSLLKILELSNIHFEIMEKDGSKTLLVKP